MRMVVARWTEHALSQVGQFGHRVGGDWSSGGPELSQAGRAERASGRLNTGRSNGRARDEQRVGWNARRSNRRPRSRIPGSWNARRSGRARQGRKRVGWNAGRSTRRMGGQHGYQPRVTRWPFGPGCAAVLAQSGAIRAELMGSIADTPPKPLRAAAKVSDLTRSAGSGRRHRCVPATTEPHA